MEVQVFHGLARVLAHVGDDTVAIVEALLLGELGDDGKHMAQQRAIGLRQCSSRRDVLFRDDQKMHFRLRGDVIKGNHLIVLVELLRGDANMMEILMMSILPTMRKTTRDAIFTRCISLSLMAKI